MNTTLPFSPLTAAGLAAAADTAPSPWAAVAFAQALTDRALHLVRVAS